MPPRKKSKTEDAVISTTNGVTNGFHPMTDPTKSYEIIAHPVRTQAWLRPPIRLQTPGALLRGMSHGVTITIGRHETACVELPQLHSHQDLQHSPQSCPSRDTMALAGNDGGERCQSSLAAIMSLEGHDGGERCKS